MKNLFKCPICGGVSGTTINTYKHYWISCNDCGNIFRHRKNKYLIPRILPEFIYNKMPLTFKRALLPMKDVIEDESKFYDYYLDILSSPNNAKGKTERIEKWGGN